MDGGGEGKGTTVRNSRLGVCCDRGGYELRLWDAWEVGACTVQVNEGSQPSNSSSGSSSAPFWHPQAPGTRVIHRHTSMQNIHIHITKQTFIWCMCCEVCTMMHVKRSVVVASAAQTQSFTLFDVLPAQVLSYNLSSALVILIQLVLAN